LDNDSPNGLVPHSGNTHDFLLALVGCSGWLLGQEDGLPGCSDAGIDFLPTGYSDGTAAAAKETVVGTVVAGSDADASAGDLACLAEVGCLSIEESCYPDLRSTNLALPILHLPTLPFSHNSPVDQMMEGREGVIHQLIVEGINQSS
jgi:hypothetical protein